MPPGPALPLMMMMTIQGRLVIELFEDIVPVAANHFRNRCMPGSSAGLAGSHFHKLLPHYAIHGALK